MGVTPDDVSEKEWQYKGGMWLRRIWNRLSGKY
jgi:hypothetical protein